MATYSSDHLWFLSFGSGDTRIESKCSLGRPSTVDDSAFLFAIKEEPEANARKLATTLGCSHVKVENHLKSLG